MSQAFLDEQADVTVRRARRQVTFAWPVVAVVVFCAAVGVLWPKGKYVPVEAGARVMAAPRMAYVELPPGVRGYLWPRRFAGERPNEWSLMLDMDRAMQRPLPKVGFRTWTELEVTPLEGPVMTGFPEARDRGEALPREDSGARLNLAVEGELVRTGFEVSGEPEVWPEAAGEGVYWVELGPDGRVAHVLVLGGNGAAAGVMRRWVERGRGRLPAAGAGIVRVMWR